MQFFDMNLSVRTISMSLNEVTEFNESNNSFQRNDL